MSPGRHENNFDVLRFAAATVVIIAHAYSLSLGYARIRSDDLLLLLGYLALAALFVVSGYLISASWETTASPARFFWKRSLRVFPALVAAVLFTLFIVGPLVTALPLPEYIATVFSWQTLASLPFFENGSAIGIFTGNPVTYVNASLWTIPVEVGMYGVVALLGIAGLLRRKGVVLLLIALDVALWMAWYDDPSLAKVRFTLYFLIGAYFYQNRERLVYDIRIAAPLLLALVLSALTPYHDIVSIICVPYLVLYAAYLPVGGLHAFGRHGDFSYGLYVYSYPIQQSLVWYAGDRLSVAALAVLTFLLTLPLAVLSWNLLESRALALKNTRPGDLVRGYRLRNPLSRMRAKTLYHAPAGEQSLPVPLEEE